MSSIQPVLSDWIQFINIAIIISKNTLYYIIGGFYSLKIDKNEKYSHKKQDGYKKMHIFVKNNNDAIKFYFSELPLI